MKTAVLFNIQRYSLFDGPGIRTVFFFKGCPLSCQWCANPESQSPAYEVAFEERNCIGYGRCNVSCPAAAVVSGKIDRSKCTRCMTCTEACPSGALVRYGKEYTVDMLLETALKDTSFYRSSGGGVTLSGGEPLLDGTFARSLLEACKNEGLDTAIETCGAVPWENFSDVLDFADTIYFDVKHVDDKKQMAGTGCEAAGILSNLRRLAEKRDRVVIRFPLIPGFNAAHEDAAAIADWIAENIPKTPVELMSYHRYGEKKYDALGREYAMKGVPVPADEEVAAALSIFHSRGIDCKKLH
ncbi:glycyl-radical enzyme activating protein [Cloacibacillus sp.]|uniref:glycyl-radical enzyme activating protein n=1 Tax=Cloacibacillus sp. TaxID=2049023 RepID=UPI0025B842EA|nr:glycyl-radical enzyme activating protein [Cloacibacillus sp.]MCC8057133.1 glycyl-radical enzyme activating protein [Cloacibacillus sp.]